MGPNANEILAEIERRMAEKEVRPRPPIEWHELSSLKYWIEERVEADMEDLKARLTRTNKRKENGKEE